MSAVGRQVKEEKPVVAKARRRRWRWRRWCCASEGGGAVVGSVGDGASKTEIAIKYISREK